MNNHLDVVTWLRSHYLARKDRNSAYSLRAFARDLLTPSGRLSEFLSRKRVITSKTLWKFVHRLEPDSHQASQVFLKLNEKNKKTREPQSTQAQILKEDQFSLIADWYHYGILSLMKTSSFKEDPVWIARRLGISSMQARDAIERLMRLHLVKKASGGLTRIHSELSTSKDVASEALRRSHRQSIQKAIDTLESSPTHLREISSITMAINPKNIPEAKKIIGKFKRDIEKTLESGEKSEVYELYILLTPLTKI